MTKTRKLISLLLVMTMVISLFAGLTTGALATGKTTASYVAANGETVTFSVDYDTPSSGDGAKTMAVITVDGTEVCRTGWFYPKVAYCNLTIDPDVKWLEYVDHSMTNGTWTRNSTFTAWPKDVLDYSGDHVITINFKTETPSTFVLAQNSDAAAGLYNSYITLTGEPGINGGAKTGNVEIYVDDSLKETVTGAQFKASNAVLRLDFDRTNYSFDKIVLYNGSVPATRDEAESTMPTTLHTPLNGFTFKVYLKSGGRGVSLIDSAAVNEGSQLVTDFSLYENRTGTETANGTVNVYVHNRLAYTTNVTTQARHSTYKTDFDTDNYMLEKVTATNVYNSIFLDWSNEYQAYMFDTTNATDARTSFEICDLYLYDGFTLNFYLIANNCATVDITRYNKNWILTDNTDAVTVSWVYNGVSFSRNVDGSEIWNYSFEVPKNYKISAVPTMAEGFKFYAWKNSDMAGTSANIYDANDKLANWESGVRTVWTDKIYFNVTSTGIDIQDFQLALLSDAADAPTPPPPATTTYTLTYDANGGAGSMTDSKSPYAKDAKATVLANGFTAPDDKEFDCWNTAKDGTGTYYAAGAEITMTSNVTLYAQWKDKSVTPQSSWPVRFYLQSTAEDFPKMTITEQQDGFTPVDVKTNWHWLETVAVTTEPSGVDGSSVATGDANVKSWLSSNCSNSTKNTLVLVLATMDDAQEITIGGAKVSVADIKANISDYSLEYINVQYKADDNNKDGTLKTALPAYHVHLQIVKNAPVTTEFDYTVKYYLGDADGAYAYAGTIYDDTGKAPAGSKTITPATEKAFGGKNYIFDKDNGNNRLTVSIAQNGANEFHVYYGLDEDDSKVPDMYEIKVTYIVTGGTWSNSSAANDVRTLVLLKDGKWDRAGSASSTTPTGMQPAANHIAAGSAWNTTPKTSFVITDDNASYTYSFPVKPVTPKYDYTVNYYLDDVSVTSDSGEVPSGTVINAARPAAIPTDAILYPADQPMSLSVTTGTNVLNVYYYTDRIGNDKDDTDGEDVNDDPDGTPDIYQLEVTFIVAGGTWNENGKTVKKTILTKVDANNKASKTGSASLGGVIPTPVPNAANSSSRGWVGTTPTDATRISVDTTYNYLYAYPSDLFYEIVNHYTATIDGIVSVRDVSEGVKSTTLNTVSVPSTATDDGHNPYVYTYQSGAGDKTPLSANKNDPTVFDVYYTYTYNTPPAPPVVNTYYNVTVNWIGYDENGVEAFRDTQGPTSYLAGSAYDLSAEAVKTYDDYSNRGYEMTGASGLRGNVNGDIVLNVYYDAQTNIPTPEPPLVDDPDPTPPTTDIPDDDPALDDTPKTGDSPMSLVFWLLFCMSGCGLVVMAMTAPRKRSER